MNALLPFFCLPQEIKDQIYELICGGQTLHVHHRTHGRKVYYHHTLCLAKGSEEQAQDVFNAIDSDSNDSVSRDRHIICRSTYVESWKNFIPGKTNLSWPQDLRFLQTCRQMHNEAKLVPYTTNLFSFSDTEVLDKAMKRLPQSRNIRSIHLAISIDIGTSAGAWAYMFIRFSEMFPKLRNIHIDVEEFLSQDYGYIGCTESLQNEWEEALSSLVAPQLKTATVVVRKHPFATDVPDSEVGEEHWTISQKQT